MSTASCSFWPVRELQLCGTGHCCNDFFSSSGKCHNQIVLTPMIEKHSTESLREQLPYTLTLISMPAATDGKRGFSVSVEGGCSSYATGVQVKE